MGLQQRLTRTHEEHRLGKQLPAVKGLSGLGGVLHLRKRQTCQAGPCLQPERLGPSKR
jgi:hypothetical protein